MTTWRHIAYVLSKGAAALTTAMDSAAATIRGGMPDGRSIGRCRSVRVGRASQRGAISLPWLADSAGRVTAGLARWAGSKPSRRSRRSAGAPKLLMGTCASGDRTIPTRNSVVTSTSIVWSCPSTWDAPSSRTKSSTTRTVIAQITGSKTSSCARTSSPLDNASKTWSRGHGRYWTVTGNRRTVAFGDGDVVRPRYKR